MIIEILVLFEVTIEILKIAESWLKMLVMFGFCISCYEVESIEKLWQIVDFSSWANSNEHIFSCTCSWKSELEAKEHALAEIQKDSYFSPILYSWKPLSKNFVLTCYTMLKKMFAYGRKQ